MGGSLSLRFGVRCPQGLVGWMCFGVSSWFPGCGVVWFFWHKGIVPRIRFLWGCLWRELMSYEGCGFCSFRFVCLGVVYVFCWLE